MDLREKQSNSRHPWELARACFCLDLIERENSKVPLRVLDVGAGDLYFLHKVHEKFNPKTIAAVDMAFDKNNKKDGEIDLYTSLDDIQEEEKFNIILLMDVLEHVKDDVSFLKDLQSRTFIDPEAIFIITVPAFQFLFSSHDIFLLHFRRYTNTTLRRLIHEAGLRVEECSYFFVSLLVLRIISKSVEIIQSRKTKNKTGVGSWNYGQTVTKFLTKVLKIDCLLTQGLLKIGIKIPGLSNYAVAKKNNCNSLL